MKVASINTNVVVNVDGSMDGTNFFTVPLVNTAVASLALSANLATITANGTYLLQASGKMKYVRLTWVSEAGGTAATLDVVYFGGS